MAWFEGVQWTSIWKTIVVVPIFTVICTSTTSHYTLLHTPLPFCRWRRKIALLLFRIPTCFSPPVQCSKLLWNENGVSLYTLHSQATSEETGQAVVNGSAIEIVGTPVIDVLEALTLNKDTRTAREITMPNIRHLRHENLNITRHDITDSRMPFPGTYAMLC